MAKKILHVETQIRTVFAEISEDGDNAVLQQPVVVNVPALKDEFFSEALKAVLAQKEKLVA